MDAKCTGKFIQELRKEKKWTQGDLSSRLFTSRETVSKWERGIYIPNAEMLLKLQELFDVSVNEILYGERINKSNEKNVNSIPVELIKEHKKRAKKIMAYSIIMFSLLLVLFFIYYFINNYNSINVYTIGCNKSGFNVDGIMIISKEKSYIQLSNVKNGTNKKIIGVEVYFLKNSKKHKIFKDIGEPINYLLVNDFSSNELFNYNDFKYLKNNLYLGIEFDDSSKTKIHLELKKDFSNNKLFKKYNPTIDENEMIKSHNLLPKYIKDKFEYDNAANIYYLSVEENNKIIYQKYLVDANMYTIEEQVKSDSYNYELSLLDNSLTYYEIVNSKITNQFTFDYKNNKCVYGKCNKSVIYYYKTRYLQHVG